MIEYLGVSEALETHAGGSNLTESDAMSPAFSTEGKGLLWRC